jgi:hypothetical protein
MKFGYIKDFLNKAWELQSSVISKNIELKGKHLNETCLIFGNGASLKYYNFAKLPKYDSIVCTHSLTDQRMKDIKVKYCILSNPYTLYPLYNNPYNHLIQYNYLSKIFKRMINENELVTFITSITNYYAHIINRPKNIKYFHHYTKTDLKINKLSYDLAGIFNSTAGALDIMIGVAKYIGYSKIILLGCDYLGQPSTGGHFYSNYKPTLNKGDSNYAKRFTKLTKNTDIQIVFYDDKIKSPYYDSITYTDLCNDSNVYQDNYKIVREDYFKIMQDAEKCKQIHLNESFSTGDKNLFF